MGISYTHMLIPQDAELRPKISSVIAFFDGLAHAPGVRGVYRIEVRLSGERAKVTRGAKVKRRVKATTGRNPFTGEVTAFRGSTYVETSSIDTIADVIRGADEFDVSVVFRIEPGKTFLNVPIENRSDVNEEEEAEDPRECIALTVKPTPVATSCGVEELSVEPTGDSAHFIHPKTKELIVLPSAGKASFWLGIPLDKWEMPAFVRSDLQIADPALLERARRTFEISFVEGFYLG